MFTVKQLSEIAEVTPRTLHYYDQCGLLKPSQVGANGYRYYDHAALLRLQQILLYRELDLPLERIREILDQPGFDPLAALESHKAELAQRRDRLDRLIGMVNDTILHLKGKKDMDDKQLFRAFSDEEQAEMEKEALQLYDPETVRASNRKWKAYTVAEKQAILDEGNALYLDLVAAIPAGPGSPTAQAGIEHWRRHMDYFWTPNLEQLVALADHYSLEPRFKANFDKIDPRLAEFMGQAVRIYVERLK
jgi:MerR family transcriptional regulator, thiopeptide resistance regulator